MHLLNWIPLSASPSIQSLPVRPVPQPRHTLLCTPTIHWKPAMTVESSNSCSYPRQSVSTHLPLLLRCRPQPRQPVFLNNAALALLPRLSNFDGIKSSLYQRRDLLVSGRGMPEGFDTMRTSRSSPPLVSRTAPLPLRRSHTLYPRHPSLRLWKHQLLSPSRPTPTRLEDKLGRSSLFFQLGVHISNAGLHASPSCRRERFLD